MRATQRILYAAAALLILAGFLPGGTLLLFVAGLVLLLTATGCAITADNRDIKFGRGQSRRPLRFVSGVGQGPAASS